MTVPLRHGGRRWLCMLDRAGDVHVVPDDEEHLIERTDQCHCAPYLEHQDPGTGRRVWVHSSRDEAN